MLSTSSLSNCNRPCWIPSRSLLRSPTSRHSVLSCACKADISSAAGARNVCAIDCASLTRSGASISAAPMAWSSVPASNSRSSAVIGPDPPCPSLAARAAPPVWTSSAGVAVAHFCARVKNCPYINCVVVLSLSAFSSSACLSAHSPGGDWALSSRASSRSSVLHSVADTVSLC